MHLRIMSAACRKYIVDSWVEDTFIAVDYPGSREAHFVCHHYQDVTVNDEQRLTAS